MIFDRSNILATIIAKGAEAQKLSMGANLENLKSQD